MSANADVFDHAAYIIERNGWTQGTLYERDEYKLAEHCQVCAMGAINLASIGRIVPIGSDETRRRNIVAEAFENYLRVDIGSVPAWNDDPDRTAAEVIAALRGAAAAERERAAVESP